MALKSQASGNAPSPLPSPRTRGEGSARSGSDAADFFQALKPPHRPPSRRAKHYAPTIQFRFSGCEHLIRPAIAPAGGSAKYWDTRPRLVSSDMTRDEGYAAPAITALATVMVLCGLYAIASGLWANLKTHLFQEKPPLIRCAAIVSSEGSPCFPDPGFTRLGIPQPLPDTEPHVAPILPLEAPPPSR
jgi:hypothetical protein